MKLALTLLAVAALAAQDEQLLNDYVDMMMRQASGEDAESEGTDLDEAIQAKHGHGPHGHGPHGHNPHRHNPHNHNPHSHNPHSHNPHAHSPHRHTPYPTPYPTPHPCDDGSHGCDKSANGICYKAGGNSWTCGCKSGYHCSRGCTAPHTAHLCSLITPAPTAYPTAYPTAAPTAAPTPYPTTTPTPSPTSYPTLSITDDEVVAVKQCCEKEIAIDIKYIMPLHKCSDVRGAKNYDIRNALRKLEYNEGLSNTMIIDWLKKNKCMHSSLPTKRCSQTTCSYKQHKIHGLDFWHTKVIGNAPKHEKFNCEKMAGSLDCECLCNDEFHCSFTHHENGRKPKTFQHC